MLDSFNPQTRKASFMTLHSLYRLFQTPKKAFLVAIKVATQRPLKCSWKGTYWHRVLHYKTLKAPLVPEQCNAWWKCECLLIRVESGTQMLIHKCWPNLSKLYFFCFSYDARSGGPESGQRWSDSERGFGNRAHFRWRDHPAYLHIDRILATEAGIYRCRVDFKTAPTKNSLLNLTVVSK